MPGRSAATRQGAGPGLLAVLLVLAGLLAMHVLPGSTHEVHATTTPTPTVQTSASPSSAPPGAAHVDAGAAGARAEPAAGPEDSPVPTRCAVAVVECLSPTPQPVAEHVALAAPPRGRLLPLTAVPLWPSTLEPAATLPRTPATHVILRT